jgi:hypothetical protein
VLPNVGPYIYNVKISGFTRSSYIYDISRIRVNDIRAIRTHRMGMSYILLSRETG